ncbi:hypothetical protein BU23DRAFT_519553 [Bimuria novae-zelandiae CBS 107.79]|uniref:Pentacotripeptide-repeat region of PRORP domain-containing protein n=1 Tax=Bimuria novae-zelandiae CBS 107.79 TaxID=1447943 RepID=A0A6A5UKW5_9PLEO|nr:hypothetical protein BU23DRAFT_519553 [Bimuria novae-zelandiae CBS 107.79]
MMRSHVCQRCRLQLSRKVQLQSRRTIVSFRKTPTAPRPNAEAQQPPEEAVDGGNAAEQQSGGFKIRYGTTGTQAQTVAPPGRRYSRFAAPEHMPVTQPQEQRPSSTRAPRTNTSTSVAQKINSLLDGNVPNVKAAWDLFNTTYTSRDVPALTEPSFGDVYLLTGGKVFTRLINLVCLEFTKGNIGVPTPTEALFRYEQIEITPVDAWKQAIAHLTYQVLRAIAQESKQQVGESASATTRSTRDTLTELLSLWRLFFQCHGTQGGRDPFESISSEWKNIPQTNIAFSPAKPFGARLQQFHPSHASTPELQFSAITIFNYFFAENQPARTIPDDLRKHNKLFLNLLTATLANADIRLAFSYMNADPRIKRGLDDNFQRLIAVQMDEAPNLARKLQGLDAGSATPEETASHMQEYFRHRISRNVMMQSNVREVEKIWDDAQKHYTSPDGKCQIPPALYNSFLSGFMTLYQPDHTVQVWNHMIANGVLPDLETWLAMLMGCAKAKDSTGLNAVWDRMLRSGVEPDQRCWTMRVHALITNRQVNAGLAALDEMGKKWLSAENLIKNTPAKGRGGKNAPKAKSVNNFTKPEIGVINGAVDAITGLPTRGKVRSRLWEGMPHEKKVAFVHKVLQWAANFSIKPDVRTYNALISLYLDGDDYVTAFKLLKQMEKEGIEGDLATHSLLLRAAFDNQKFDGSSHKEQADRVVNLFVELERGGLRPNGYLFSMAIDRLLKLYGNFTGVRAVMDHMMSRGFRPGPQIYGSLATHYLQQDPPAIRELDTLVGRILGPPPAPTDRYLFDRILEGYARNDVIGSMMTLLTKMGGQGKRPSFHALSQVVRALYRTGDWERARSIIRDVQQSEGIAMTIPMATHNVDRDQFFHIVEQLCPELLESFAGEHMKTPVREGGTAAPQSNRVSQVMMDDEAAYLQQDTHDQTQAQNEQSPFEAQAYEEDPLEQQPHDQAVYEQTPYSPSPYEQTPQPRPSQQQPYDPSPYEQTPHQQMIDMDDEFVNAEHAGYLSDEPQQQWRPASNDSAGSRQNSRY